ncbi:MAG: glycosyltransferase family 4 protein [Gemmatales bacterium]
MRVLAMTSLFPNPYQPNKWSPNQQQLRWLAERVPVDVIAPLPWTSELTGKRRDGNLMLEGRHRRLGNLNIEHPRYWFLPGMLRGSSGRFYRWSVRKTFEKHVNEFKPDIVFTQWAYPDGWAAVKLAHAAGLPVVLQVLGSDVLLLHEHPGRKAGTLEALKEADGIWAVSQDLARNLKQLGVAASRIRVIYDGVDPKVFHSGDQQDARRRVGLDSEKKVILFVGNLAPVKALDKLLQACEQLKSEGIDFHAALIGQGELKEALEQQRQGLSCRDQIKFYGSMPQETLPDWYRAADVFVLPSYSEGVPNVLLEASACGLPYVASNVGGIPEIAERGNGTLVPSGDVPALAAAIRQTLSQPKPAAIDARTRAECINDFLTFLGEVHARFHRKDIAS